MTRRCESTEWPGRCGGAGSGAWCCQPASVRPERKIRGPRVTEIGREQREAFNSSSSQAEQWRSVVRLFPTFVTRRANALRSCSRVGCGASGALPPTSSTRVRQSVQSLIRLQPQVVTATSAPSIWIEPTIQSARMRR